MERSCKQAELSGKVHSNNCQHAPRSQLVGHESRSARERFARISDQQGSKCSDMVAEDPEKRSLGDMDVNMRPRVVAL